MSEQHFQCTGCGETDTIEAISAVPRHQGVQPDGAGGLDYRNTRDETFWEAETTFGFGCANYNCKFNSAQYGIQSLGENHRIALVKVGPSIEIIARIVEA